MPTHLTARTLTINGETKPMKEWAKTTGVSYMTIYCRKVYKGWADEDCIRPTTKEKQYEYNGKLYTVAELEALTGKPRKLLAWRIRKWKDVKRAVEQPLMTSKRSRPVCGCDNCDECPYPDCVA